MWISSQSPRARASSRFARSAASLAGVMLQQITEMRVPESARGVPVAHLLQGDAEVVVRMRCQRRQLDRAPKTGGCRDRIAQRLLRVAALPRCSQSEATCGARARACANRLRASAARSRRRSSVPKSCSVSTSPGASASSCRASGSAASRALACSARHSAWVRFCAGAFMAWGLVPRLAWRAILRRAWRRQRPAHGVKDPTDERILGRDAGRLVLRMRLSQPQLQGGMAIAQLGGSDEVEPCR